MAECRIPAAGHLGNDSLVERPSQRTGTGAASPLLIVLAGLPGSGKSAFRERWLRGVADRAAWVALSTDDLVEAAAVRAGSTYDAVKRDEAKPAGKAFRHALREALERRANVIVDRTNLTPDTANSPRLTSLPVCTGRPTIAHGNQTRSGDVRCRSSRTPTMTATSRSYLSGKPRRA